MITIGLTGGIASGKSVVCQMFAQKGAIILDADEIAHETILPEKEAWGEIVAFFGEDILLKDSTIDRKKLASIVFNDVAARKKLNSIVHPRVIESFTKKHKEFREKKNPPEILVYDVPLLLEAGMEKFVDVVVLVYTPVEIQSARLKKRDGLTDDEIEKRIAAQMPLNEKKKYADYTIDNGNNLAETKKQVEEFWSIIPLIAKERENKYGEKL